LSERLDQFDELRPARDEGQRLRRRDAIGGETGTAAPGEDEPVHHESRTRARSGSVVKRTVGRFLSRDFSFAGASHAVERPSAAAGLMSESKLSPTIHAGFVIR